MCDKGLNLQKEDLSEEEGEEKQYTAFSRLNIAEPLIPFSDNSPSTTSITTSTNSFFTEEDMQSLSEQFKRNNETPSSFEEDTASDNNQMGNLIERLKAMNSGEQVCLAFTVADKDTSKVLSVLDQMNAEVKEEIQNKEKIYVAHLSPSSS